MTNHIRTAARALAVALLGLTAACSDVSTAPATATTLAPTAAPAKLTRFVGDTMVTTFTYVPLFGVSETFYNGDQLTIPAGAVCDPLLSGYGPTLWDAACVPSALPIAFTVKAWMQNGHPRIQVWPDVRFGPGKTVTLRMRDAEAAAVLGSAIAWCPTGSSVCVDEAKSDPTLITRRENGTVFRRLKHFSGYHIILGRACDDMSDPNCVADNGFGGE